MDDITTRTIVIAVNIFVTIAIISLISIMFIQMQEIYGVVATTDTSIYNKFDDVYSMYNGKVETGIGLLNTLKKYEDDTTQEVIIKYTGDAVIQQLLVDEDGNKIRREVDLLREKMKNGDGYNFEDKYNVIVYDGEEDTVIIEFSRIVQVKE